MNKFSRQLHNEIANNFKIHQDVNDFEIVVKYCISGELTYDFGKLYSSLFGATYSFKDIYRALKKSGIGRNFNNNYKNALARFIKGDYSKVIEREDNTVNVLKDVYDMIALLENTDGINVINHVRNYEQDLDTLKTFLIGYLKNESHPSLEFKLLLKVYNEFKENHPNAFKSLFSKLKELSDSLGVDDIQNLSYRTANDKEADLTKQVIDLFNLNKENIVSVVNDLKNIKGDSFNELYDLLTNKISKYDVEEACRILVFYCKKSPALRVLLRFSLPAIANRFEAIEDTALESLKNSINNMFENVNKEFLYEVFGEVYYKISTDIKGSLVEVEEICEKIKKTNTKKHQLENISIFLNISPDECAKINSAAFAFLIYVHAGNPEKAINYYLKHQDDTNDIDIFYKILELFYSNIERTDEGIRIKIFSNNGEDEKQKMAANLLFYSLALAKNGFDPNNIEVVKQYQEMIEDVNSDNPDIINILESNEEAFNSSLDEYSSNDYDSEVEYFRNALMSGFSKYVKFPSITLHNNFNAFASKVLSDEDQSEFMKDVFEDLSATQISRIISSFKEMLDFYPEFKKYFLIFLMSALGRNFSVNEMIKQISDDPNEIIKIKKFVEMAAPAGKKEHFLALAGLS